MASILNRIAVSAVPLAEKPKELPKPQSPREDDNALVLDLAAFEDIDVNSLPVLSQFDELADEETPEGDFAGKPKEPKPPNGEVYALPDLGLADLPPLPHRKGAPYEQSPRLTLIRMIQECQMGEEFRVQVPPGKGRDYLQAMRQCISRARTQAIAEKRTLTRFKLFCDKVIETPAYDELVLYRGHRGAGRKNAYSELLGKV